MTRAPSRARLVSEPWSSVGFRTGLATLALWGAMAMTAFADDDPPAPPSVGAPTPLTSSPEAKKPAPASASAPGAGAPKIADDRTDWRSGDELEVRVLSRDDLSSRVKVVADGSVDVPFAGRFRASGRTLEALRADLEAGFAKHERQPQVAVTVASLAPEEFFVLGEVTKAGVYTFPRTKRVSLLQAIGMAGGFGAEADYTRVQVIPAGGAAPRFVDASPARLVSLAAITVGDGDTIQVPSVGRIYLMGQLNRTGGFAPPAGERMTLLRAIALGGGFTRLADAKNVLVKWRDASGEEQTAAYNVNAILAGGAADVPVYAGNVISVPERLL